MKTILFRLFLILAASKAQAVIIAGGDGTGNTGGTGVTGWDYVGKIDHATADSSVTYLGNDWFVTAYHVKAWDNPTGVVFNASNYAIDAGSWTRITNSTGTNADLVLFKASESVSGISAPTIASSSPSGGTALTMIGNGRNRSSALTTWYVDTTPETWIWSTSEFTGYDATAGGYTYATGSSKRWGANTVETAANIAYKIGVETNYISTFYTDFDAVAGEAQGAVFDSGGGVFTGDTNDFELAGIMITIGTYNGQPGSTAVFGNSTYMADLSVYRDQIMQTIPEPGTLLSGTLVLSGFFLIRRSFFR